MKHYYAIRWTYGKNIVNQWEILRFQSKEDRDTYINNNQRLRDSFTETNWTEQIYAKDKRVRQANNRDCWYNARHIDDNIYFEIGL